MISQSPGIPASIIELISSKSIGLFLVKSSLRSTDFLDLLPLPFLLSLLESTVFYQKINQSISLNPLTRLKSILSVMDFLGLTLERNSREIQARYSGAQLQ